MTSIFFVYSSNWYFFQVLIQFFIMKMFVSRCMEQPIALFSKKIFMELQQCEIRIVTLWVIVNGAHVDIAILLKLHQILLMQMCHMLFFLLTSKCIWLNFNYFQGCLSNKIINNIMLRSISNMIENKINIISLIQIYIRH